MAGKRIVKTLRFTHSGETDTLSQVVEIPEGGAAGNFDIWHRRISGNGEGYIEYIYGSFEQSGENGYQLGNSYDGWSDELTPVRWWGDDNQFPYLKIEAEFYENTEETTIEVYIVSF